MRYFILFSLLLLPATIFAQDKAFVPLTNIPALTEIGSSSTLPIFLNNLYKICIGLAAVLAVLQLIRAGIMYMMGDSVTEKKEAKNLIGLAVMGLVLVLSPTIVFGLINKDILELNLDVKVLNVDIVPQPAVTTIPYTTDKACKDAGGTVITSGQRKTCEVKATSKAAEQNLACKNFEANSFQTIEATDSCRVVSDEHAIAANSCCSIAAGSTQQCCGVAKNTVSQIRPAPIKYTIYAHVGVSKTSYEGPVAAEVSRVTKFNEMCIAAKGRVEIDYNRWSSASITRACTAEELAGYGKNSGYIQCRENVESLCAATLQPNY